MDMLSNLPEGVKEKILSCVGLEEAGRTSILSSEWRNTWTFIPELTLTDYALNRNERKNKFVKFVDSVFLLHNAPIQRCNLFLIQNYGEALDRWFMNLSRHEIKDLMLCMYKCHSDQFEALSRCLGKLFNNKIKDFVLYVYCADQDYTINTNFFYCDAFIRIILRGCTLRVPSGFNGFKLLHTLLLSYSSISGKDFKKLISSCPMLETLQLKCVKNDIALEIHAPNLRSLEIRSGFSYLKVFAPKLLSLCVEMDNPPKLSQHNTDNISSVLGNMLNLEQLEMKRHFLSYLCVGPWLEDLPLLTFGHLKEMDIFLDLEAENVNEIFFVLSLFQRAPRLQSLNIDVAETNGSPSLTLEALWEKINNRNDLFKQLQTVNISCLIIDESILPMVKFILGSARHLNTLTIKISERQHDHKFKQLLCVSRLSPKAEIIIEYAETDDMYGCSIKLEDLDFSLKSKFTSILTTTFKKLWASRGQYFCGCLRR